MIRQAHWDDVSEIMRMSRDFYGRMEAPYPFDESSVADLAGGLLQGEKGVMLVADAEERLVGMAGAVLAPFPFNRTRVYAQELCWWIEPEHRGGSLALRLLKQLEISVKELGASGLMMLCLENLKADSVGRFYERRGYRPQERSYFKEL